MSLSIYFKKKVTIDNSENIYDQYEKCKKIMFYYENCISIVYLILIIMIIITLIIY